ncbi:hypothetical protein [Sphingomonas sp.]
MSGAPKTPARAPDAMGDAKPVRPKLGLKYGGAAGTQPSPPPGNEP